MNKYDKIREIKVKALGIEFKNWCYGFYFYSDSGVTHAVLEHKKKENTTDVWIVDKNTLCEFTSFQDINGVDIYTNDILGEGINKRIVKFINGQFVGELMRSGISKPLFELVDLNVTGNILDNLNSKSDE